MAGINNGISLDFGNPGDGFLQNYPGEVMLYLGNTAHYKFDGGGLYLPSGMPSDPQHAASKYYVDTMTGANGGAGDYYLPIGGGHITGNLSVAGMFEAYDVVIGENFKSFGDAAIAGNIVLGRLATGLTPRVYGVTDDTDFPRWDITLGNADAETPLANNGSNFEIATYTDLGVRSIVLRADRQSKRLSVVTDPVDPLGIATKQYVDNNAGGGGGSSVISSDTMPVGAPNNTLWWDSSKGKLFINFADADSTQFVEAVKLPPQIEPGIEEAPVNSTDLPYARRKNRWVRVPMKGHLWGLSVMASNTSNPGALGARSAIADERGLQRHGSRRSDRQAGSLPDEVRRRMERHGAIRRRPTGSRRTVVIESATSSCSPINGIASI